MTVLLTNGTQLDIHNSMAGDYVCQNQEDGVAAITDYKSTFHFYIRYTQLYIWVDERNLVRQYNVHNLIYPRDRDTDITQHLMQLATYERDHE